MAAHLEQELEKKVRLDSGGKVGEFTVTVNGNTVARKKGVRAPDWKTVAAAVRTALQGENDAP